MAEKNLNNSWNPLNYSQNLCVNTIVSNTSVATNESTDTLNDTRLADTLLVESLSSLDLQNSANNGINQLVNELITNHNNDYRMDYIQSLNKSHSINAFISDNTNLTAKTLSNVFDCGDFGINSCGKDMSALPANGINGYNLSASQTEYNSNSLQMISNSDLMSSQRYAEIKSFPHLIRSLNQLQQPINARISDSVNNSMTNPLANQLINSMNNSVAKGLPNPTTNPLPNSMNNQLSTALSSGLSQSNSNQSVIQSLIASKSQSYNQNQTFQRIASHLELSAPEMGSRQFRSIRARNATQNSLEPMNRLNYYFDKSYEQFKHLEKERKKIECELIQTFVGQKISSANNIPIQRLPQNASKVDRIIIDMSREHAKVITIVAKMEQLKGREFSEGIHNSIHKWYEIIRDLQMKRKIEIQRNATNNGSIGSSQEMTEFITQFCEIMKQLLSGIRSVRTCLWCALVITLYDQNMS